MIIGLVACGSKKLNHPAEAQDLYTSGHFTLASSWVKGTCDEWAILSALHGLIMPDQVLDPYEQQLSDLSPSDQNRWGMQIRRSLLEAFPADSVIVTTAGKAYRQHLPTSTRCPWNEIPRMTIGKQQTWLKREITQPTWSI
jgi:hypothetical protein